MAIHTTYELSIPLDGELVGFAVVGCECSIDLAAWDEVEREVLVGVEPAVAGVAEGDQVLVLREPATAEWGDVVNCEDDVFVEGRSLTAELASVTVALHDACALFRCRPVNAERSGAVLVVLLKSDKSGLDGLAGSEGREKPDGLRARAVR